ncbi:MAG TPA: hypothetical protein VEY88_03190 [Archangium sp.]|nr:hypothetical protein [Archangium sp.]
MRNASRLWLLLVGLLAACATSSPIFREADNPPAVVGSWEEGCEDAHSLVLLCREDSDECGFFRCREYRGGR